MWKTWIVCYFSVAQKQSTNLCDINHTSKLPIAPPRQTLKTKGINECVILFFVEWTIYLTWMENNFNETLLVWYYFLIWFSVLCIYVCMFIQAKSWSHCIFSNRRTMHSIKCTIYIASSKVLPQRFWFYIENNQSCVSSQFYYSV